MSAPITPSWRILRPLRLHLAHQQHRAAYYLTLNNVLGAATGFLFWLLLARVGGLSPALIGLGYTSVAIGTILAVLGKGGLDTALLQKIPGSSRISGIRLLQFAVVTGAAIALLCAFLLASVSLTFGWLPDLTPVTYAWIAAIATLLILNWLQDAYFMALGLARLTFRRVAVLSATRLALPLPLLALAIANPVPVIWVLALLTAAIVGIASARIVPPRDGRTIARPELLRSAMHNVSGGAAEYLPGLLLVPLVLALNGPVAAAFFGIAWTSASLVFQSSAAIGRSALAEMIRGGAPARAPAIRKGLLEHLLVVAPLALGMGLLAPQFLGLFGPEYAVRSAQTLVILCASAVVVMPVSLYLAVLRSRDPSRANIVYPLAMLGSLAAWAPLLGLRYGMNGVAMAWAFSNAPFAVYAAWRLRQEPGVNHATPASLHRRSDLE